MTQTAHHSTTETAKKPDETSVGGVIALVAILSAIDWFSIRVPQIQVQQRADAIAQVLRSGHLVADIALGDKQFVLDARLGADDLSTLVSHVKHAAKPVQIQFRNPDGKSVCTVGVAPEIITTLARRASGITHLPGAITREGMAQLCGVSVDVLKDKVKLTFDDTQFQQQFASYTGQEKPYTLANHIAAQGTVIPEPQRQIS